MPEITEIPCFWGIPRNPRTLRRNRRTALTTRDGRSVKTQIAASQLFFPLIHEWPIDRARAEIGHMRVPLEPRDRCRDQGIVLAKDRSVRGSK